MPRYAFIGCEVLMREFYLLAAQVEAIIDPVMLPQGLHCTPPDLRARVQEEIDRLEGGPEYLLYEERDVVPPPKYDAILLGYALCSNGVVGLTPHRIPLVIPRGHDCITLFIGSKEKYREYFDSHRGIYWYSSGWIERTMQPGRERQELTRKYYVEQYGEDNADYLMEMEQNWYKEYNWATYINWDFPTAERDRAFTRDCAEFLGWNYDEIQGDQTLMRDFMSGNWDDERFLIVPPGECIEPSHDPTVLKSCAGCACHGAAQMDACDVVASNTVLRR
ncbi:MAG: DUF1638 domain-containing protein [Armatimonadota bacterium]